MSRADVEIARQDGECNEANTRCAYGVKADMPQFKQFPMIPGKTLRRNASLSCWKVVVVAEQGTRIASVAHWAMINNIGK